MAMNRRILSLTLVFSCALATLSVRAEQPGFLAKKDPADLRVLCFNINWDSIFAPDDRANHKYRRHDTRESFVRILRAVKPDIICLQELNPDRKAKALADMLDEILPLGEGQHWQAYLGRDNLIAAPFPLRLTAEDCDPPTGRGHATALIDLPDARYPADLYVVNAHFKSAGGKENIARRQRHADALMAWIRDARRPGGHIDLPAGTPMVICGDLNVYDNDARRHYFTLMTGDILDEKSYGADFLPDWDNTIMGDALPVHNARGVDRYTWRNDTTPFNPGALDRVIYTDSVLRIAHAYILDTATMTDAELAAAGLERADVALNLKTGEFDHFPIVVDFEFRKQNQSPDREPGGSKPSES